MIRNATDLTPTGKAAVETLLGRSVQEGEAVSVRTFEQARISPQEHRLPGRCLRKANCGCEQGCRENGHQSIHCKYAFHWIFL